MTLEPRESIRVEHAVEFTEVEAEAAVELLGAAEIWLRETRVNKRETKVERRRMGIMMKRGD